MNTPVTISVVAPIYGVEKYIAQFAESVFNQPCQHVQFVFVNDGTRDSSIDVLNSVIERYSHLRDRILIVNKENGGLPAARKTGMEHVTGDYVWHVDPDDWIEAEAFASIAEFAQANDCPDVIYFDFFKDYPQKRKLKREKDYSIAEKKDYIRNMYIHSSYGCVWNKCVKRSLYHEGKVDFPVYSYGEDTFLTSQLLSACRSMAHLKTPLYHYRKGNPDAITRQNRKKRHREYALNFLDLYEKYRVVPAESNPLSVIFDDLLLQAAWYSMIYGLDLFSEKNYLAEAVRKAKIKGRSNICLLSQVLVKLYSHIR